MSSARESLFLFRYPVLRDPPCDIAFAPDASLGKLAHRLRKGLHLRDLVGPLAADPEQRCDLGYSGELHYDERYPLTASRARRTVAIDTVKRKEPMSRYSHTHIFPNTIWRDEESALYFCGECLEKEEVARGNLDEGRHGLTGKVGPGWERVPVEDSGEDAYQQCDICLQQVELGEEPEDTLERLGFVHDEQRGWVK